jgi:hypothetical protein
VVGSNAEELDQGPGGGSMAGEPSEEIRTSKRHSRWNISHDMQCTRPILWYDRKVHSRKERALQDAPDFQ